LSEFHLQEAAVKAVSFYATQMAIALFAAPPQKWSAFGARLRRRGADAENVGLSG
jgi:hypothetical protein